MNESTAGADASVEVPKLHNMKLLSQVTKNKQGQYCIASDVYTLFRRKTCRAVTCIYTLQHLVQSKWTVDILLARFTFSRLIILQKSCCVMISLYNSAANAKLMKEPLKYPKPALSEHVLIHLQSLEEQSLHFGPHLGAKGYQLRT